MREKEISVARALQTVVDMIAEAGPGGGMCVRMAMLLQLLEGRVDQETYRAMLQDLSRYVAYKIREIEFGQIRIVPEQIGALEFGD
jgi:hypothetical protein